MSKDYLNYFCKKDKKLVHRIEKIRTKLFLPISRLLMRLGFTADAISYLGLFILIGFIYFIKRNPIYASLFLLAHVLIDAFDGPLARLMKQEGDAGAFTDIICDHTGMVVVVCSLIFFGFVNPLYAAIYIYIYTVMIVFVIIRNKIKIPPKLVIRTKYYVYLLYALWAFTGLNYLDYGILLFTVIKLPPVFSSYFAIKNKLRK